MAEIKIKEDDYIFACARVKAKENSLLGSDRVEKLIEAKTPDDAMKLLAAMGYAGGTQATADEFEQVLKQEHRDTYEFIKSIIPNREVLDLFLYPADYHNLKAILKAEFQQKDPGSMLLETGSIDVPALRVMVRERNYTNMTSEMQTAVAEVIDTFGRTGDPQAIDLILDKACYRDMFRVADMTDSQFLKDYVRLQVATVNLRTFVRVKQIGQGWDFFSKVFIEGGKVGRLFYVAHFEDSLANVAELLRPFGLGEVLEKGAESLKETGRFTLLEKLCDDKLTDFIKAGKYKAFGIEPPVAYLLAKENDLKTVRIIMAGKLGGLEAEAIRERLRETYV